MSDIQKRRKITYEKKPINQSKLAHNWYILELADKDIKIIIITLFYILKNRDIEDIKCHKSNF